MEVVEVTDLETRRHQVQQPLRSGELIGSRYRLDGVAGAGGMATVWRAYDERLERAVAIKVISDELATNPAALARFAREARTHARIQHPNLVQVYDYSVTAAQPYLVMEYIDGCTLSERLDRGGLSAAAIQTLATELLSAIAFVHDHGVLHRDIKSGNVLLDRDGRARLTDFGLARLEDSTQITRTNEVVGTLRFLAPELIQGKPASRQSDLYALGVLLRTATEKVQAGPPWPKLIKWLTEPDPDARPSDAHAVLAALRQSAAPNRPPVRGDEPTKPLRISDRRHYSTGRQVRNRTAAVSALLVAVAGTAFVVIDAGSGSPAHRTAAATAKLHTKSGGSADVAYSKQPGAHLTIDQQLQQLASGVKRAAKQP
jgi:eukaryotic-like serine/threonine-protein kinase